MRLYCYAGGAQAPPYETSGTLIQSDEGILSYDYHGQVRAVCDDGFNEYSA